MAAKVQNKLQAFPSMPNFRTVGHQESSVAASKDRILLYRSSRPDFLTEDELSKFRAMGIRCILDFRSRTEYRKATGNKILDYFYPVYKIKLPMSLRYRIDDHVQYIPIDTPRQVQLKTAIPDKPLGKHFLIDFFKINYVWAVFNRAPLWFRLYSLLFLIYDVIFRTGYRNFVRIFAQKVLNPSGLTGQYIDMVNHSKGPICSALKLLADPNNVPAMINCAHGKDRTGMVSAMVLGCIGRSKEEIAQDYARSAVELEPMKERLHKEIVEKFDMCTSFTTAKAETMMGVLNYVEQNFGSIPNYLESIGFGAQEQEQLRNNLTGSSSAIFDI